MIRAVFMSRLRRSFLPALLALSLGAGISPAFADDAGKDLTIEEFLQQLSTVQGVVQRKDPFAELEPPFPLNGPSSKSANVDPDLPNMNAPPLERYPVADYEVVAVLLGDKYPRALM